MFSPFSPPFQEVVGHLLNMRDITNMHAKENGNLMIFKVEFNKSTLLKAMSV